MAELFRQPVLRSSDARVVAYFGNKYALPYQPTSFSEWKSEVIRGIAYTIIRVCEKGTVLCFYANRKLTVTMMDMSNIIRKQPSVNDVTVSQSFMPEMYSCSVSGTSESAPCSTGTLSLSSSMVGDSGVVASLKWDMWLGNRRNRNLMPE